MPATRDLVVCVNGNECSVEELGSTKGISEMGVWAVLCLGTARRSVLSYRSVLYSDTCRSCVLIIIMIIIMCDRERSVVARRVSFVTRKVLCSLC